MSCHTGKQTQQDLGLGVGVGVGVLGGRRGLVCVGWGGGGGGGCCKVGILGKKTTIFPSFLMHVVIFFLSAFFLSLKK